MRIFCVIINVIFEVDGGITMLDMFKQKITIELDDIPKTSEDICLAVAKYCVENNMQYEFLKRTEPVIAIIDGTKYEIKKVFTKRYRVNLWVLRCTKIYE